jgi:hypothetical protein
VPSGFAPVVRIFHAADKAPEVTIDIASASSLHDGNAALAFSFYTLVHLSEEKIFLATINDAFRHQLILRKLVLSAWRPRHWIFECLKRGDLLPEASVLALEINTLRLFTNPYLPRPVPLMLRSSFMATPPFRNQF